MLIATYANVRTTFLAMTKDEKDDSKYNDAFKLA
jgi:Na+/H+-translocating membrane pyrophosphatase